MILATAFTMTVPETLPYSDENHTDRTTTVKKYWMILQFNMQICGAGHNKLYIHILYTAKRHYATQR